MERYNIFNLIHKGLRAALYHTALQLQQTDFYREDEREEALNRVREIIMLFENHAAKEDHFILPNIQQFEPSVVTSFLDEHKKDEELGLELQNCIEKLENVSDTRQTYHATNELTSAFTAFMIFNLEHMDKEEKILNELLWRYYDDDEIQTISSKISASVSPWLQDFYATWMIRGINNAEAFGWMKAVESSMPPVILKTLFQKARTEWPQKRYRKIRNLVFERTLIMA